MVIINNNKIKYSGNYIVHVITNLRKYIGIKNIKLQESNHIVWKSLTYDIKLENNKKIKHMLRYCFKSIQRKSYVTCKYTNNFFNKAKKLTDLIKVCL